MYYASSGFTKNLKKIICVKFTKKKKQTENSLKEVRQEAVQQALAALKNRPKPSLPMPSKRSSVFNRSPERENDDSGNFFLATGSSFLNNKIP